MSTSHRRIMTAIRLVMEDAPNRVRLYPGETDLMVIEMDITGAEETAYEGGVFRFEVRFSDEYPLVKPVVRIITQIYHVNFGQTGEVHSEYLDAWQRTSTLRGLIEDLRLLLDVANYDNAVDQGVLTDFVVNNESAVEKARQWTKAFANEQDTYIPAMKKKKLGPSA